MKKVCAIVALALLSPFVVSQVDAGPISEGPLHWTARHVRNAAVTTGDVLSNVGRTTARVIDRGADHVRRAFE
jgi:hypothetical protein